MPAPPPHRSPTAAEDVLWDWSSNGTRYTNELIDHRGWEAMARAHAWHEPTENGPPRRKSAYKLPHHRLIDGRVRVVLEGVRSALNIIAATRFQPGDYDLHLPAEDIPDVYEHLAVHLEEFGEERPAILRGWSPQDGWPPTASA